MAASPNPPPATCPRCGGIRVKLCGQSISYSPETHRDQPLSERELYTFAFQCECGMGFTFTATHSDLHDADSNDAR